MAFVEARVSSRQGWPFYEGLHRIVQDILNTGGLWIQVVW